MLSFYRPSVANASPGFDEKDRLSNGLFELLNTSFDARIEMGIEDALLAQGVVFPEGAELSFE